MAPSRGSARSLDAEERRDLVTAWPGRTIAAAVATRGHRRGPRRHPGRRGRGPSRSQLGARPLRQRSRGLNAGIREARDEALAAGAGAILILPIDLPAVSAAAIEAVGAACWPSSRHPSSRIVADRHGRGTNALLLAPPDVIEFQFGGDSHDAHVAAASGRRGAAHRDSAARSAIDLDTPEDLLLAQATLARSRSSVADRVEVIALDGLGEIVPGDDLARPDRRRRWPARPSVLPLRDDDVLVVTQKIVSKAEGAIVDLTTVEPRPEAVEFARRYDRDPRQVEVVLREARRVVRMANGVIITETPHGFVCANGGIDASNVGPGSGDIVTLLPRDPDASAGRHPGRDP